MNVSQQQSWKLEDAFGLPSRGAGVSKMGTVRASKPVEHERARSLTAEVESARWLLGVVLQERSEPCVRLCGERPYRSHSGRSVHSVPCSRVYNTAASGTTRSEWPENPWCIQVTGCCTLPRNAF